MPRPSSRNAKQLTTSVLEYLKRYARWAALRNDRRALGHFEECWVLVFVRFYGGYSLPCVLRELRSSDHAAAVPASKPPWHAEKYSRPARRVLAQIAVDGAKGRAFSPGPAIYDVLACGHQLEAAYKDDGSRVSKWRYCNECRQKERSAALLSGLDGKAA